MRVVGDAPDNERAERIAAMHARRLVHLDPLVVVLGAFEHDGAAAMAQLLSIPGRTTAVYAHSDEVALGAVRTIRRIGLRVPEDVSVVGIDDHPLARITGAPTLHEGRVYVPTSSYEEAQAGNPAYDCCTFRGSVSAIDAATGAVGQPAGPVECGRSGACAHHMARGRSAGMAGRALRDGSAGTAGWLARECASQCR